jgi:poly(hydroxyalkanoate) depolymerase family esterase
MATRALVRLTALLLAVLSLTPAVGAQREDPVFRRGVHDGRPYRLYVPDIAAPAPLVVALHGCAQTAEDFARGTRLNEVAARRGLLVLYPVQERRNNLERCWNWFEPAHQQRDGGGEVAEILSLIARVRREQNVARGRTIVLGLSAGAFMAVNLACAAPDVVGGIGTSAGGPYGCGHGPDGALRCMLGRQPDGSDAAQRCLTAMGARRQPVRASLWHGERDSVVSPTNMESLAQMFRSMNGATSSAVTADGSQHVVYRDRLGHAVHETWLVTGMGHAWSGGDARGTHTFPSGPDATAHMLRFLLADGER